MKKIETISRIILAILTFIVFKLIFINENPSWNIISMIFALIVFFWSSFSTKFANKIIEKGNTIENKLMRIGYYILIPFIIAAVCIGIYLGILLIYLIIESFLPSSNDIGSALSGALIVLFIVALLSILVIVPYVQAIIIMILKKIIKE